LATGLGRLAKGYELGLAIPILESTIRRLGYAID
jgi:hypothetical protein